MGKIIELGKIREPNWKKIIREWAPAVIVSCAVMAIFFVIFLARIGFNEFFFNRASSSFEIHCFQGVKYAKGTDGVLRPFYFFEKGQKITAKCREVKG